MKETYLNPNSNKLKKKRERVGNFITDWQFDIKELLFIFM